MNGDISKPLWQRQLILRTIREALYAHDFLEAETPMLVKGTCPDVQIDSIIAGNGYLVTSTEYQIKRLIVDGWDKVFTLTKNFRANEKGPYHSSEFTMLEWARAHALLEDIEEDAIRFIRDAFRQIHPGKDQLNYRGHAIDMASPWERLTVREAFSRYLRMHDVGDFSLAALCESANDAGVRLPANFLRDQHLVLSFLLDLVQPYLGKDTPTFLREWPAFMTSSAQLSERDPHVAERSELYMAGIEIADGFPFLRDAGMQRDFFAREQKRREEEGKPRVVLDEKYIEALERGIPSGAGMALGIDRLVMVLLDKQTIGEVQAFSEHEI